MLKKVWLAAAGCVAIMAGGAVQAVEVEKSPGLEEIVVTAQKVSTNEQKTPIAIEIISGAAITSSGVDNAKDLNRLVSALSVQVSAGGGSSFFIRGVGSDNGNANTDNGVAVNFDQVYFSRTYGPDLVFYDIQRIEVLKGPQGTLYGRNATGGVINIISTKPDFDKFGGYGRLEAGNYGEIRANAAINLPFSDTLAARLAIQTNDHNGYLTDGYDDNKTRGGRAHLLWKPSDDVSLLVSGEYDHALGKGQEAVPAPNNAFLTRNPYLGGGSPEVMAYVNNLAMLPPFANPGTPLHFFSAPGSCYPGCIPPGFIQSNANTPFHPYQVTNAGYLDVTVKSLRAALEWNLGFGTLSVVPGVLNTNYETIFFLGPPPFYNKGSARQQSLELRLASPQDQRLTWLVGAFGQHEKQSFEFLGAFGAPFAYRRTLEPDVQDHAVGIFAQTGFEILPTLTLVTGARYSAERKAVFNAVADNSALFLLPPFLPPLFVYSVAPENRESSSSPTYRVGLDWQATPDNLLYTSFATGFHSGGTQQGQPPVRPICVPVIHGTLDQFFASVTGCDAAGTYKPEHLNAYTIGSKNRFFDNRLQVNLEVYDWKYKDLQVGTLGLSNPNQTNQVIANAGSAEIRGLDVEARVQISHDDEAGIAANYNHSRYGSLVFFNYIVGAPFPPTINDFSGKRFVNAPDLTFTAHYQHVFNFSNTATLTPVISAQHSSGITYSLDPPQTQAGYTKVDLGLTYRSAHDRYELALFARNVNNVTTINSSGGTDSTTNLPFVYLAAPRTYGGSVQVNF